MKRDILRSLALVAALAAAPLTASAAEPAGSPEAAWGFGAGSLAGAALGGPAGLVAGGIVGALTGAATGAEADRAAAEARAEQAAQRSARLAAALAEARTALAEPGAAAAPDGLDGALALEVLFRTDSAALDARDRQRVERVARVLERYPELRVTLTGHADRRGNAEYNEALSRQRAEAVRDALVETGVAPGRLRLQARGEQAATAPTGDPDGLALDRRVSLEVSAERRSPEVASGR